MYGSGGQRLDLGKSSLDGVVVYRSSNPAAIWCYTPAIIKTRSGRLIVTIDIGGPGVVEVESNASSKTRRKGIGKIIISDDDGITWLEKKSFPFWHASIFASGDSLYIIGNAGNLFIIKSEDDGSTWSCPSPLTDGELWHGSATSIIKENGYVYICMELRTDLGIEGWNVAGLTPVVLRGEESQDLTTEEAWVRSEGVSFREACGSNGSEVYGDYFGVPFYPANDSGPKMLQNGIVASPPGWLEGNLIRIKDPKHLWYDPSNSTLHIILRTNTNGSGYAAVLQAKESSEGGITVEPVLAPSGNKMMFMPFPGGSLKFFIAYDDVSGMYWLASSIINDSMCKIENLPSGRYNLPSNQRNILGLYYSSNCVDWMFACIISKGEGERHARNYPSFVIDGHDILVVSRSGDGEAQDGQYTNLITFHRVESFRSLIV